MFEKILGNAGAKIKLLAKINFIFWLLASCIIGLILTLVSDFELILLSPIFILVGFFIGWTTSILWYLIGEVANDIHVMRDHLYGIALNIFNNINNRNNYNK